VKRGWRWSATVLWVLALPLAFLSFYRPFTASAGRARRIPVRFGECTLAEETPLTPRERALLGTDDAVARTYTDAAGHHVFLVAVFHQHNWKSVHPPDLCLRGSDMVIEGTGVGAGLSARDGGEVTPGRIVTRSRQGQRPYLSLFVYGAAGLRTGEYSTFVLHHLPRAVLRRAAPGYLLRVEAWLDEGDAEARCRAFLRAAVPALEALLDG
jgi:EpsI family protein